MTNSLNENIQKWLELQKIIKEEITLSDISKIFINSKFSTRSIYNEFEKLLQAVLYSKNKY